MSFTTKILIGVFAGIALGLFFGELTAPLDILGDVFIGMLQMTVMPYIILSLVINLGRISWAESRSLLVTLIVVFLIFLLLGATALMVTPIAFPPLESASFFKSSLVTTPPVIDLVALYVPSNPFASMANNLVPAVVLFSIFVGVGISSVPNKNFLLDNLEVLADGLNKVNKLMITLTPYGVFAIAASTAGTISIDDIYRIQGYLITYSLLVLVLSYIVMPLFVNALTPFSIRDFIGVPKNSLITIFATAKIIVLLPQLIDDVIELFRRYDLDNDDVEKDAQIVLPLAYPFPHLGTYVILMFVVFAGWYLGQPLDFADQLTLQGTAIFSSFISPLVGIPFLLDVMRLPSDVMELFVVSTVYTDRIRVVLGAMHLLAMTVIVLAIRRGVFKPNWRKLGIATVVSIFALTSVLLGTRAYLATITQGEYVGDQQLLQIQWMQRATEAVTYDDELPEPDSSIADKSRLDVITARKALRVGYLPDSLPWAFRNEQGMVTGFDIELAHSLARDLDVKLELVRISFDQINELLDNGQIDIVMSGTARTSDQLRRFRFAGTPLDLTLGFLVPDYRRKEFAAFAEVLDAEDVTIGVVQNDRAFARHIQSAFPDARITQLESVREFLRGELPEVDAVVSSAQGGSAWTLIYPDFSIVVPQPVVAEVPLGYIVPNSDDDWAEFIDEWVVLRRKDTMIEQLFNHWIVGGGAESTEPRWSVIRDVLGWVD